MLVLTVLAAATFPHSPLSSAIQHLELDRAGIWNRPSSKVTGAGRETSRPKWQVAQRNVKLA
jgi:hypothetical protein